MSTFTVRGSIARGERGRQRRSTLSPWTSSSRSPRRSSRCGSPACCCAHAATRGPAAPSPSRPLTAAMAWGAAHGWDDASFRVWYLAGALLSAPLLGVGSLTLWGRRWAAPLGLAYAGLRRRCGGRDARPRLVRLHSVPHAQDHVDVLARVVAITASSLGTVAVLLVAAATWRRRPLGNALVRRRGRRGGGGLGADPDCGRGRRRLLRSRGCAAVRRGARLVGSSSRSRATRPARSNELAILLHRLTELFGAGVATLVCDCDAVTGPVPLDHVPVIDGEVCRSRFEVLHRVAPHAPSPAGSTRPRAAPPTRGRRRTPPGSRSNGCETGRARSGRAARCRTARVAARVRAARPPLRVLSARRLRLCRIPSPNRSCKPRVRRVRSAASSTPSATTATATTTITHTQADIRLSFRCTVVEGTVLPPGAGVKPRVGPSWADQVPCNLARTRSFTTRGSALPPVSFITWPTKNPSRPSLPPRNCSAWPGIRRDDPVDDRIELARVRDDLLLEIGSRREARRRRPVRAPRRT